MKAILWVSLLTLLFCALLSASILAQDLPAPPPVRHHEIKLDFLRNQGQSSVAPATMRVPLENVAPFLAVGAAWQATPGGALQLSIRASADGVAWSEWLTLPTDYDSLTENGEQVSGLALLDAQTRFIEYRFETGKLRQTSTAINRLRFHFISPGATPHRWLERIAAKQQEVMSQNQASPNYPKPPVVTRTEWGCPDGQVTTHGTLSYTSVTHLIVHHTATGNLPPGNNDWAAVVRSIWNFHIFTNGWADIGYNYLVDPDGVIYEGRAGGDNVLGAHFSSVNAGTLGVSMIGTFTDVAPSEQALTGLRRILAWKAAQRGLDPLGKTRHAASGLELNNISGHRDGPGSTECPGEALYPLLASLREDLKTLLGNINLVASVSAASFSGAALASEAIVAAFGAELAATTQAATGTPLPIELAGTMVTVRDSAKVERFAPLFFVSPEQVNYQIPPGLSPGQATVSITNHSGRLSNGTINIEPVAPALFAANANGRDVAAALVLRVQADGTQSYEPVAVFDPAPNQFVAAPIDLSSESDQVFLVLFGTGIRQRSSLETVTALIGGEAVPVLFAGAVAELVGLDQVNLRLSRSLIGRGLVEVALTVEGKSANVLKIQIK